jgi:hypothetical protein
MRRAFQRRYGVNVAEYVAMFGNEEVVRYRACVRRGP